MRKILVTGVGGNVGQYLAQSLCMHGYSITGIYRNKKPEQNLYKLMQADLASDELYLEDVDTVIHVAAGLYGSTESLIKDNIEATFNLVRFAEKKVKRFIYMSTVSVYGKVNGELNIDSDIVNPGIYGATKYIAENLVKEADIPVKMVIGLPRMLGPFVDLDNIHNSGFLTMTKKILENEDVTCFIPNARYNNYMHVSDLKDFLVKLLDAEAENGYVKVLLGAKESLTMSEILQIMKEAADSKSNILSDDRNQTAQCALVSIDEAIQIGYSPMSSAEILRKFIVEVKENTRQF